MMMIIIIIIIIIMTRLINVIILLKLCVHEDYGRTILKYVRTWHKN